MRLETPTDPRDIIALQGITEMQELKQMIAAEVHAILAAQRLPFAEPVSEVPTQPTPTLSHGKNNTVMQRDISEGQDVRRHGRPGILRQPILDVLRQHPEGLTAVELKVYLGTNKHIGDTLSGMARNNVIEKQGSGKAVRYIVPLSS
jgi:hypothetical protein